MPESLFAPRRFRRSYLVYCFVGALCIEGSIVVAGQIFHQNKTYDLPPTITTVDADISLGEPVQELILPKEDPIPTPENEPTPPPEETPPPEDTPPPEEEPEMTLDTPKPTPAPTVAIKRAPPKPAGTPFPANAKRGDVPQNGVVGGVPHAEKTAGTPGGKAIGVARHTPQPPYPAQARAAHITGSGVCHISCDASGS